MAGRAALQAEKAKRHEYGDALLPFCLETTGRLGPAADRFLYAVAHEAAAIRSNSEVDVDLLEADVLLQLRSQLQRILREEQSSLQLRAEGVLSA
eukprot:10053455-Prorocentrum_lima.AAC.1